MLQLYTYNAGKGDCIRIRFGETHNIFIDTGVTRFGNRLKEICRDIVSSGDSLDLLILTHVDDDHIGGILSLLRMGWKCPFSEVRMNVQGAGGSPNAQLSTRQNSEVYRRLLAENVPVLPMMSGDVIEIDGAFITTISPASIAQDNNRRDTPLAYRRDYGFSLSELADMPIKKSDQSINNRNSIVLIFEYGVHRLLFTGDAWAHDIVSGLGSALQHFDLVKLPHHGAVGNICEDFKDHIASKNFLICTDGVMHPDKQTIGKLIKWYGKVNIFSPSAWWKNGFFTEDDDTETVNMIYKEGLITEW